MGCFLQRYMVFYHQASAAWRAFVSPSGVSVTDPCAAYRTLRGAFCLQNLETQTPKPKTLDPKTNKNSNPHPSPVPLDIFIHLCYNNDNPL